mmetsp:Transcript_60359/g.160726  ORF Transcript_60359/g.160726 Transcript_60359/m.160726 type:complete len:1415 (-) Transcript_60359:210-4454(-)
MARVTMDPASGKAQGSTLAVHSLKMNIDMNVTSRRSNTEAHPNFGEIGSVSSTSTSKEKAISEASTKTAIQAKTGSDVSSSFASKAMTGSHTEPSTHVVSELANFCIHSDCSTHPITQWNLKDDDDEGPRVDPFSMSEISMSLESLKSLPLPTFSGKWRLSHEHPDKPSRFLVVIPLGPSLGEAAMEPQNPCFVLAVEHLPPNKFPAMGVGRGRVGPGDSISFTIFMSNLCTSPRVPCGRGSYDTWCGNSSRLTSSLGNTLERVTEDGQSLGSESPPSLDALIRPMHSVASVAGVTGGETPSPAQDLPQENHVSVKWVGPNSLIDVQSILGNILPDPMPWEMAIYVGDSERVKYLLQTKDEQGLDIRAHIHCEALGQKVNPVLAAAISRRAQIVELLLRVQLDSLESDLVSLACVGATSTSAARALLDILKENPHLKATTCPLDHPLSKFDLEGQSLATVAAVFGGKELARLLSQCGCRYDVFTAVFSGDVQWLRKRDYEARSSPVELRDELPDEIRVDLREIFRQEINQHWPLWGKKFKVDGLTPLMAAVKQHDFDVFQLLLKAGADVFMARRGTSATAINYAQVYDQDDANGFPYLYALLSAAQAMKDKGIPLPGDWGSNFKDCCGGFYMNSTHQTAREMLMDFELGQFLGFLGYTSKIIKFDECDLQVAVDFFTTQRLKSLWTKARVKLVEDGDDVIREARSIAKLSTGVLQVSLADCDALNVRLECSWDIPALEPGESPEEFLQSLRVLQFPCPTEGGTISKWSHVSGAVFFQEGGKIKVQFRATQSSYFAFGQCTVGFAHHLMKVGNVRYLRLIAYSLRKGVHPIPRIQSSGAAMSIKGFGICKSAAQLCSDGNVEIGITKDVQSTTLAQSSVAQWTDSQTEADDDDLAIRSLSILIAIEEGLSGEASLCLKRGSVLLELDHFSFSPGSFLDVDDIGDVAYFCDPRTEVRRSDCPFQLCTTLFPARHGPCWLCGTFYCLKHFDRLNLKESGLNLDVSANICSVCRPKLERATREVSLLCIFPDISPELHLSREGNELCNLWTSKGHGNYDELLAPSVHEVARKLQVRSSRIVHLGGHSCGSTIIFDDPCSTPIETQRLVLIEGFSKCSQATECRTELVFLNACSTFELGFDIKELGFPYIICWRSKAENEACLQFASAVYNFLTSNPGRYGQAFKVACFRLDEDFVVDDPDGGSGDGIPCLIWNDEDNVDPSWTGQSNGLSAKEGILDGKKYLRSMKQLTYRNWGPLKSRSASDEAVPGLNEAPAVRNEDEAALAGQCERKFLRLLGFDIDKICEHDSIEVKSEYLKKHGMLNEAGCGILGIKTFKELFEDTALEKAKQLTDARKFADSKRYLNEVIEHRKKDLENWKAQPTEDRNRKQRWWEASTQKRHQDQLERLQDLLQQMQSIPI